MIKLSNVSKSYDGHEAVKNISLHIKKGEFIILLGPSGCGKSTTLRLINKMIERSSGEIYVQDENIDSIKEETLRKNIGYVIQSIGLFPHMTVALNISTVPLLKKWDKKRIEERTEEMLSLVGLSPKVYLKKYPHELSGGEAQRIGVARALASDPEILLMDEPFGAVDPINRVRLQKEFKEIQKKLHKTVIFVTHDVEEALFLGDRICIMREGEIIQVDTPSEIVLHPKDEFIRDFFQGEGVLSLLGRYNAKDFIEEIPATGESLAENATLKEALSEIILRQNERIPMKDGSISLQVIMEAVWRGEHEKV
ncbi:MAG: ABC transporter ATP-binding protein [Clostridiaceae bacterium]